VDGDAEQRKRERRVKRRALAVSILLQSAILTVLVLIPLFGKTQRIAAKEWIPIPPYGHARGHQPTARNHWALNRLIMVFVLYFPRPQRDQFPNLAMT
jgi:hypothetical protein